MNLSNLGKKRLYSQPFYDLLKTTKTTFRSRSIGKRGTNTGYDSAVFLEVAGQQIYLNTLLNLNVIWQPVPSLARQTRQYVKRWTVAYWLPSQSSVSKYRYTPRVVPESGDEGSTPG